jgi:hypothetical protein
MPSDVYPTWDMTLQRRVILFKSMSVRRVHKPGGCHFRGHARPACASPYAQSGRGHSGFRCAPLLPSCPPPVGVLPLRRPGQRAPLCCSFPRPPRGDPPCCCWGRADPPLAGRPHVRAGGAHNPSCSVMHHILIYSYKHIHILNSSWTWNAALDLRSPPPGRLT